MEEVMRSLDDIVRQGKILYIGISDAPAWWIAQAKHSRNFEAGHSLPGCRSNKASLSARSSAN